VGVVVGREDVGGEDDERAVRELCVLIPKSVLIDLVSDLAGEAEKRALELRLRRRFLRRSLNDLTSGARVMGERNSLPRRRGFSSAALALKLFGINLTLTNVTLLAPVHSPQQLNHLPPSTFHLTPSSPKPPQSS
jgi:hypothetical protein